MCSPKPRRLLSIECWYLYQWPGCPRVRINRDGLMSTGVAVSIPWSFTDSLGLLQWSWVTEHFVVRIVGEEVDVSFRDGVHRAVAAELPGVSGQRFVRAYTWSVCDLIRTHQGLPRVLVEGSASSFDQGSDVAREHVGKLYDPRLGYQRFAGALATTFTISTGDRIDVSSLIGTQCSVTVLLASGGEETVVGDFSVDHYSWQLTTPAAVIKVVPEHVLRIANRSEAAVRAHDVVYLQSYSGVGRIYHEETRPGCTGRPGFVVGVVDHAGAPRCPLHERALSPTLLD